VTNAKWDEVVETDAMVKSLTQSAVGKIIGKWEEDKTLEKLILRDEKGNLVASSSKPILYNNANRPPFQNGFKGVWAANEVKPDPTTQKKNGTGFGSRPVMEGGKAIGVLQTAVLAE
jgi:hypothetical protein